MLLINNKNIENMFFGTDGLTVKKIIFNDLTVWNKDIDKMQLVSLSNKNTNLDYEDVNPEVLLARDYTSQSSASKTNNYYKIAHKTIDEFNVIQFPVAINLTTTFTLTVKYGGAQTSISTVVYTASVTIEKETSTSYTPVNVLFEIDEENIFTARKYTSFALSADKAYKRCSCASSSYTLFDSWMNSTSSPTGLNLTNSVYNNPQIILWKTE